MKKVSLIIFGSGVTGFLISGAGLDGPDFTASVILIVASFAVAAVGYRLRVASERKEAYGRARKERRRKEIEATEKANAQSKEATFQVWLRSCKLDVSV